SSGSITKTPRLSSTSSWTIRGIWNSIRLVRTAIPSFPSLLRVKLDDERFLDRRVDLLTLRPLEHLAGEAVVVGLEPRGHRSGQVGGVADDLLGRAARLERDDVVGAHLVAGDVHAAAVDLEVTVADGLGGLGRGGGEAEPVDDV